MKIPNLKIVKKYEKAGGGWYTAKYVVMFADGSLGIINKDGSYASTHWNLSHLMRELKQEHVVEA